MMSDKSKAAIVSLGVPLVMLVVSISFAVVLDGNFGADPDHAYLLNGLNILHFQSPGHADHPGTPLQILGGAVIGVTWLVRCIAQGQVPLDDDVLRHPEIYLSCINAVLILLTAAALAFFGRQLRLWTGSFAVAIVGQISLLISLPVLISLPRVTPEPLLISLTIFLAGLLAPAISQSSFPWQRIRYPLLIGATLGACVATKVTAAPLILVVALLRGVRMQAIALMAVAVISVVLTLPVAASYGAFLRWILALAIHSGNYGGGSVGLPSSSEFFGHLNLLFESFPDAFVSVVICAVMLLWHPNNANPDRRPHVRFFVVCALLISVQLITVAKHYALRYAVPVAAIIALANAGAVYVAAASQGAKRVGFTAVLLVLLGLGMWHAALAASDWYGTSYIIAREQRSLITKAASGGCLFVPYYGASPKEFNLYFGNRFAKGRYARRLAGIYPDFLTYDGKQFEDFVEVLAPAEAARRLSAKQCVYIFGSPIERFDGFGIPASDLIPIARSQGGLGDALAIYQLSPEIIGRLKPEAHRQ
jgi:hypothetical protein